jgi:hypothetical protein
VSAGPFRRARIVALQEVDQRYRTALAKREAMHVERALEREPAVTTGYAAINSP